MPTVDIVGRARKEKSRNVLFLLFFLYSILNAAQTSTFGSPRNADLREKFFGRFCIAFVASFCASRRFHYNWSFFCPKKIYTIFLRRPYDRLWGMANAQEYYRQRLRTRTSTLRSTVIINMMNKMKLVWQRFWIRAFVHLWPPLQDAHKSTWICRWFFY